MKIIDTSTTLPQSLTQWEREAVYNGLDCCVTHEVWQCIHPQLNNQTNATYQFSKELQGPVLEMRLRGILVDSVRKNRVIDEFYDLLDKLEHNLEQIVLNGVGMHYFNWRSGADLQRLFYDKLQIPVIRKGGRPTVDRNALEKMENYLIARPIVRHIMAMRDIGKKLDLLRTEIDSDGRIRTSYNIAGTTTGRFSSSMSEFGTGGNLQNVEESLRSIFISDPEMKFAKFDAKSGESYVVGAIEWNLFNDGRYLDACESGDPHTATARICWPGLAWTGVLSRDKNIAEQPYYRHYTYRFMCKKLGHGSNYGGKAETLSQQAKVPISVVTDFQPKYFKAFPAHLQWQDWVEHTLRTQGQLTTLTGRRRQFWGRRSSQEVLREAIAYDPQGSLADIVNRAMLDIWRRRTAILMMQDHDALTFMYPENLEDKIIPKLQNLLPQPIELKHNRTLTIPYDCKVGWNRGDWSEGNPDGLKDYTGKDKRKRSAEVHFLDRVLRRPSRQSR